MRTRILNMALALTVAIAVGCVTAHVERLSPSEYPPLPAESVTVFIDLSELQVDTLAYERVAIIYLKGTQDFTSQEDLFERAREEAGKVGANGVIIMGVTEGRTTWNALSGAQTGPRQGNAMAIRWWVKRPPGT